MSHHAGAAFTHRCAARTKRKRGRYYAAIDALYEQYGVHSDVFQNALFLYSQFLADTNHKVAGLRPHRNPGSRLTRKRVHNVTREKDSDDHMQELWKFLVQHLKLVQRLKHLLFVNAHPNALIYLLGQHSHLVR